MVNIYANNLKYIKEGDAVKVKTIAQPDIFMPVKLIKYTMYLMTMNTY